MGPWTFTRIVVVAGGLLLGLALLYDCTNGVVCSPAKGRDTKVRSDLAWFAEALTKYRGEFGQLPEDLEALLVTAAENPDVYDSFADDATDPWGNPYVYERLSPTTAVLRCLGADGIPGGTERDDRDIERRIE
ncbi:MAG: type II secretion system protein GspG [Planctomycetes bacterium]|nr:type II secretion system protein GspG [Planctomycetota bacterium]MCC7170009.1 type II secretion system protein GspG [Planctomycetota bacterium]